MYQGFKEIEVSMFPIIRRPKQDSLGLVCGSMLHSGFQALSNLLVHNPKWIGVLIDKCAAAFQSSCPCSRAEEGGTSKD